VHWMETIGELHFPVSSVTTKHPLMFTGTKDTLNAVDSTDVFAAASITTPVVQPAVGHFTDTFETNILQFFFTKIHCTSCCKIKELYEFVF